jgi:hypothetical protein
VVFPIVRRVFSKLLANDIVSVQAMNLPIGKLFYFVPNIQSYSDTPSLPGLSEHYAPYGAPDGPDSPNKGYNYNDGRDLYDRFYEGNEPALDPPGLFDYSKGSFSTITSAVTSVVTAAWDNTTLNLVPSNYNTTTPIVGNSASNFRKVLVIMSGFAQAAAGKLIGPDGNPIDTEAFLSDLTIYGVSSNTTTAGGGPYLFRVVTQRYGKGIVEYGDNNARLDFPNSLTDGGQYDNICDVNGNIYLEIDLQVPTCITCGPSMDGYTGSTFSSNTDSNNAFTATYRLYKNLEFEDKIGEVSFDLMSVTVSVTERKLRAQWSPEMAQDVAAFHNIDAEAELTALLSEQVAAEIDREILRDLRKGAAWNLRWDYNGWKRLGNGTGAVSYTQKDWNQTLITAINQLSAQIHKSTLRGGANWIVVSSEVSAIFDDLEYFHVSNAAPEQDQYNMGIERVGTLAGRYQVYRDPYFPPNQVLIGHKGTSLLDTGYIYAPYVPLQLTPTMYNPFNFTPIKGIMTRYAKKMVNNRFYGRITVDGVRTFDLKELR